MPIYVEKIGVVHKCPLVADHERLRKSKCEIERVRRIPGAEECECARGNRNHQRTLAKKLTKLESGSSAIVGSEDHHATDVGQIYNLYLGLSLLRKSRVTWSKRAEGFCGELWISRPFVVRDRT